MVVVGPSVGVDLRSLADEEGESSSETSDTSEGERDLLLSVNIGVEDTQNVLKVSSLFVYERLVIAIDMIRSC